MAAKGGKAQKGQVESARARYARERRLDVLAVFCPKCGAPPDTHCTQAYARERLVDGMHPDRYRTAGRRP